MVLPFGMNIPLYMLSAVLACGVPPRTATGRQRNVSDVMALMYSSLGISSKVGRRSFPTTLSSSSCARGMKLGPNLTHARKKLARDPADCTQRQHCYFWGQNVPYCLYSGTKWRARSVCNFKICHPEILLLLQDMLGKAIRGDTSGYLITDLVHEFRVKFDIFPTLFKYLSFPWSKYAWYVFKSRVSLYGEFSRDARRSK